MNFNDEVGKRRLLDLKVMDLKEAKSYCMQFPDAEKQNREMLVLKRKIAESKKTKSCSILAIKMKNGKVIGIMEVFDMNSSAYITITIPNEVWNFKYGEEAIDQFVKICKEQQYFEMIEVEKNNPIIERYVSVESREIKDYQIKLNN